MSAQRLTAAPVAAADTVPPVRTAVTRSAWIGLPEDPWARVAFSGRSHGNLSLVVGAGDVAAARAGLLSLVGLRLDDAVFMEQVHGGAVAVVGHAQRGRGTRSRGDALPAVDALVTFDVDVGLVVLVADCVPLLLVDPGRGVAAVHAGRGGVAARVVPAALATLTDRPTSVVAVMGPAIGGCCYEVPAALAEAVSAAVPAARARTSWGAPALDLPAAVESQLQAAGVARVQRMAGCTRCDPQRWFSHRAGAPAIGRQGGVVCRRRPAGAPAESSAVRCLQW